MSEVYYEGCAACDQRKWLNDPNTDLEAANPSAIKHTCPLESAPSKPEAAQEACEHEHEGKDDGLPCPLCWQLPEFSSPSPAATTQPEPKPAPQDRDNGAENLSDFENISGRINHNEGSSQIPMSQDGANGNHRMLLTSTAMHYARRKGRQNPDINDLYNAAIELMSSLSGVAQARLEQRFHQLADMTTRAELAEARLAELESAQPKAEPVAKLVSDEDIELALDGIYPEEDCVEHKAFRELQQYRQREERRGE